MQKEINKALEELQKLNSGISSEPPRSREPYKLKRVLVANRGEIAKRFFMALREEGIPSVAVVTEPDRDQSWYEFADEVIHIGDAMNYTNIPVIIAAALLTRANSIYPGYGFLSENHQFVDALSEASKTFNHEIAFMGPPASIMKKVGNKLDARQLAVDNGVALFAGTENLNSLEEARKAAEKIGYPVIIKLNAGGGGKGMIQVYKESELEEAIESATRIGASIYKDESYYMEKFIVNPVHVEVQIFNGLAVGLRKCAVQRRNQKVIEESGDFFLNDHLILKLLSSAETVSSICGYSEGAGAGTVEFLYDADSGEFGFLEINTRLQVEYAVTDLSLGIDLVKWQIFNFDGRENQIPAENVLKQRFIAKEHAIQCRIYAEDPLNNYAPAPGKIQELDLPTFNGVRCDFGFKKGDEILPDYDPLVGKLITHGKTRQEAIVRMERALSELYIKGIVSNIEQLLRVVRHEKFLTGDYTNRLLDEYPELQTGTPEKEDSQLAAVLGALSIYGNNIQQAVTECFITDDLEDLLSSERLMQIPTACLIEINDQTLRIDLVQSALASFYAYVNGSYYGEFKIISRLDGSDDFHVSHNGHSYPIRADRRPSHLMIRTLNEEGRISYHRMKAKFLGAGKKVDPPGLVRSPFQGSFVKFAGEAADAQIRIKKGSVVKKGDAIIVIAAMKMETTLRSPGDGRIDYLIDDGDLSRLVKSVTKDGLIQGRSISEGEVLFIIKEDSVVADSQAQSFEELPLKTDSNNLLDHLNDPELAAFIKKDPGQHIEPLLELLKISFLGYYPQSETLRNLEKAISELDEEFWGKLKPAQFEKEIEDIISIYSTVKKIFSPALSSNLSFFGEINQLVLKWDDASYRPPYYFRDALGQLFRHYGINKWTGARNNYLIRRSFLFIMRAYYMAQNYSSIIKGLVMAAGTIEKPELSSMTALNRLALQEQTERDDQLASFTRKILSEKSNVEHKTRDTMTVVGLSRRYLKEYKKFILDEFVSAPGVTRKDLQKLVKSSLEKPEAKLLPDNLPDWVKDSINDRFEKVKSNFSPERLNSPIDTVIIFRMKALNDQVENGYLCLSYLKEGHPILLRSDDEHIIGAENFENAAINGVRILAAYESEEKLSQNRIEILAADKPIEVDLTGRDPRVLNYSSIRRLSNSVLRFFLHVNIQRLLIDIAIKRPGCDIVQKKLISVGLRNSKLFFDIMQPNDRHNPYWNGEDNPRNQRIFDRHKWPIEIWAEETFDPGSYCEIKIESIDQMSAGADAAKVGARIYEGTINEKPALFFMKDSRIAGGATGDLEGRKFMAAGYIAYRRDIPLYVWNDGAGANIKQGLVSLNRAAEGFMMNAILSHRVSPDEFRRYTSAVADPVITELFKELENSLKFESNQQRPRSLFLTAIGIGSSTGLDVYGSSQANIQTMVDTDESYRVLTGAGVIKAVTGEDLTNYKIGGARVMGNWTGTVDQVASNKIDLLVNIRQLHDIFASETELPRIERPTLPPVRSEEIHNDLHVNSEETIIRNVDHGEFLPFKDNYYGSRSLIGGFARVGGRRALIMGPRTHLGIRSLASVLRARELLDIAKNTNSAQILIFGKRWYFGLEAEDELSIRARMDWMQSFYDRKGIRVHIVTDSQGLRKVALNAAADAVIYVKHGQESSEELKFCSKVCTFMSESLDQAFDLARRIINLIDPVSSAEAAVEPSAKPTIPTEATQPFDMVGDVICKTFDQDSFLEFYNEMNDPAGGPTLVTGLARLNNQTVGIIADQPLEGGAPDAPGTEKFRFFMEFLTKNNLPVIMLSNAPGFVPGTKQERLRIQQIGGFSLDINVLSKMPVVSVVLNQNYGGRQIHAFSKFLRPGIAYIALSDAQLAVMGASAAFDLFQGAKYRELIEAKKESEAEKLKADFIANFREKARAANDGIQTGVVDWTIDSPTDLRPGIIKGLELARERSNQAFGPG